MTVENGNKQESQENTISPVPDAASSQGAIEPDQIASGAAGTGQKNEEENEELEWARRHVPPDPYLPVRKTEIIGWGVPPRHKPGYRQWIKKMMKQEMMERDEP
jgi:hypothetical protein